MWSRTCLPLVKNNCFFAGDLLCTKKNVTEISVSHTQLHWIFSVFLHTISSQIGQKTYNLSFTLSYILFILFAFLVLGFSLWVSCYFLSFTICGGNKKYQMKVTTTFVFHIRKGDISIFTMEIKLKIFIF